MTQTREHSAVRVPDDLFAEGYVEANSVRMTHYLGLLGTDEPGSSSLARVLKHNRRFPEEKKDPRSWPEAKGLEFGDDDGLTSSIVHRERLAAGFRKLRESLLGLAAAQPSCAIREDYAWKAP
jgi:hypothetical protein